MCTILPFTVESNTSHLRILFVLALGFTEKFWLSVFSQSPVVAGAKVNDGPAGGGFTATLDFGIGKAGQPGVALETKRNVYATEPY